MTGDSAGRVLQLNAVNEDVWRRTGNAMLDSVGRKPSIEVKCRRCGRTLGAAGNTAYGPLFTSGWPVELPLDEEFFVDGRMLSRREALRLRDVVFPVRERSGPPIRDQKLEGTLALLALPPEMHQEYPDLMVRCDRHGDAVLLRQDLLDAFREGRAVRKVDPSRPHLAYVCPPHVEPLPGARTTRSHETRRHHRSAAAKE